MIPLRIEVQKIFVVAVVSVAILLFSSVFLYQAYAQLLTDHFGSPSDGVTSRNGAVYLSAHAAEAASLSAVPAKPVMLEVHIANNGLVLLRGARVISISYSTIRVGMAWGASSFTWRLDTDSNTRFLTPRGEKATFADIQVGDTLTVTGLLTKSGTEPTIDAETVREQ